MTPELDTILSRLAVASDYWLVSDEFAAIEGFLDPIEGYALLLLAQYGPGVGAIVEIGSFAGRSTAYLARGSRRGRREKVVAVDHFQGSPEHQPGGGHEAPLVTQGRLYAAFEANLARVGERDRVHALCQGSAAAVAGWSHPIRLLFIDGDHGFAASRQDFESWSPFLVPQGLAVFHDIGTFDGVTAYYAELLAAGAYREVLSVGTLRAVSRAG
ncbi:MAG: class I SAM-dependent methyltransferase [Solidesulfovibrio sp. DCME]|uniref:class I SAM-dependent methyltransferase n=1 Tax=Solidesulfovibrio sp. DCME TaxID=3447380 RepID=UPI003D0FC486